MVLWDTFSAEQLLHVTPPPPQFEPKLQEKVFLPLNMPPLPWQPCRVVSSGGSEPPEREPTTQSCCGFILTPPPNRGCGSSQLTQQEAPQPRDPLYWLLVGGCWSAATSGWNWSSSPFDVSLLKVKTEPDRLSETPGEQLARSVLSAVYRKYLYAYKHALLPGAPPVSSGY